MATTAQRSRIFMNIIPAWIIREMYDCSRVLPPDPIHNHLSDIGCHDENDQERNRNDPLDPKQKKPGGSSLDSVFTK
ncbi:hypothetical protein N9242_07790, partial [Vicingaceae bacterium]|nr:hypothetical protein [Vicingaceae bacterium]